MKPLLIFSVVCLLAIPAAGAAQTRMVHVYNATPEETAAGSIRVFITVDVEDAAAIEGYRDRLIDVGARHVNVFDGRIIVCDLPKSAAGSPVLSAPGFTARLESEVPDHASAGADEAALVKGAYRLAERAAAPGGAAVSAGADFQEVVREVSPERARRIRDKIATHPALAAAGPGAAERAVNQNSEILTGSIKVFAVFPESNGKIDPNREDWVDMSGDVNQDYRDAIQGVYAAFLSWQLEFPNMGIDYWIDARRPDCDYEPILHTMTDDDLWILDAMRSLDPELATIDDPLGAVHVWNEKHRGGYDWVFTMFIGHSRTVIGHRFGDGDAFYTAYANLGGPYQVTPFPAGGDPNNIGEQLVFTKIIEHESGHVFWTLDEYPGSPGSCASTSGYLNYANMNINMVDPNGQLSRCIPEIHCIMNGATREDVGHPYCRWSRGHLGVIDDNGNAVPDVFEAEPLIRFETEGPDTVNVGDYTIRLDVVSQAVPNQNTRFAADQRVDYAAPLKETRFSVGGGWHSLPAEDGKWDGMREQTSIRLNGLPPGATKIKFQARNSVGLYSREYVRTVYFLGITFSHLTARPRPGENVITWEVVGENFGSRFDVYRLLPHEGTPDLFDVQPGEDLPGTLVASDVRPSGPGNNGFVPYRAVDDDVRPGVRYRYYVNASGEVLFQGDTRAFNSPSKIVGQTAMLPVPSGRILSYLSPNPFRDEVTFSVDVPPTFTQMTTPSGSTYEQRVATSLAVTVYDVLGRRVRTLHNAPRFDEVVTLSWDGTDGGGTRVSSGIYFVSVRAGDARAVEKVLLVR